MTTFLDTLKRDVAHIFNVSILSEKVVIAGEYVASPTATSCIGLFVLCGKDHELWGDRVDKLLEHFHFNSYCGISKNCNTHLRVVVPGTRRNVTIEVSDCSTAQELIENFRIPYTRCAFDGKRFYNTKECLYALQTRRMILRPDELDPPDYLRPLVQGYNISVTARDTFHAEKTFSSDTIKQALATYVKEHNIDLSVPQVKIMDDVAMETKENELDLTEATVANLKWFYYPESTESPEKIMEGMQKYLYCGDVFPISDWKDHAWKLEMYYRAT